MSEAMVKTSKRRRTVDGGRWTKEEGRRFVLGLSSVVRPPSSVIFPPSWITKATAATGQSTRPLILVKAAAPSRRPRLTYPLHALLLTTALLSSGEGPGVRSTM